MSERSRGRPRKRWIDVVEENSKRIAVNDWRNIINNRDKWHEIMMAAKTFVE